MKKNELVRIILAFLVIAVITLVMREFRSSNASVDDFPDRAITASETLVDISIADGSTGSQIANQLFERGIIESSQSFFRLAVSDERAKRIAPGIHQLNQKISSKQALEQLLDSNRMPNLIRIIEGSWNVEIFEMLKKSGFSDSQINQAIREVQLPPGFKSLEGLLFPAQYSFALGTTATQALQSMVFRFQNEFSSLEIPDNLGFSSQELVIVASIIQAEGGRQDFSKVSAVIKNRLKIGMPLQMDSTIHYAQKMRGNIFLSTRSTLLKSPFNTYKRYGLPPGPIGNPGLDAFKAAINPATGNWLYFVTVSPGDTRFTSAITEFNQWKALYIKNRKAGAFK
ncbi:MAG: endolytic transglycosylase MltG [Candidatus Planktophila sp.]